MNEKNLPDRSSMPDPALSGAGGGSGWERQLVEKVLLATVAEQRRARRWGIFFRLLTLLLIGAALFWSLFGASLGRHGTVGRHTALVEMNGPMDSEGPVTADAVIESLRAAFEDAATAGIVLRINSPGGSPVQAGMINDEIRRLRAAYPNTPLYTVVEDLCASAGYYVAVAGDKIYVNRASLVGSIGVLMDGFGFTGLMDKLGVERRLLTAGANKGYLDPFSPVSEAQKEHARQMLAQIHQQFIDVVREGRGKRLKETPELFSGLVWSGATSVEMGLADDFGSVQSVARDVIKAEDVVDFTQRASVAERLARRAGISAAEMFSQLLGLSPGPMRLR
jgi:protease-4